MRITRAPSPSGRNDARAFLFHVPIRDRRGMAYDQAPENLAAVLGGLSDEEMRSVLSLIGSLRKNGRRNGNGGDQIEKLKQFLESKGLSSDEIRTACDLAALGPGLSACFGGAVTGGNFRGAPHSSDQEKQSDVMDPLKDRARDAMIDEEIRGCEPVRPRGDRRMGGDEGDFFSRFPNSARIGSSPFDPGRPVEPCSEPARDRGRHQRLPFDRGDRALTDFDRRLGGAHIKSGLFG